MHPASPPLPGEAERDAILRLHDRGRCEAALRRMLDGDKLSVHDYCELSAGLMAWAVELTPPDRRELVALGIHATAARIRADYARERE